MEKGLDRKARKERTKIHQSVVKIGKVYDKLDNSLNAAEYETILDHLDQSMQMLNRILNCRFCDCEKGEKDVS